MLSWPRRGQGEELFVTHTETQSTLIICCVVSTIRHNASLPGQAPEENSGNGSHFEISSSIYQSFCRGFPWGTDCLTKRRAKNDYEMDCNS